MAFRKNEVIALLGGNYAAIHPKGVEVNYDGVSCSIMKQHPSPFGGLIRWTIWDKPDDAVLWSPEGSREGSSVAHAIVRLIREENRLLDQLLSRFNRAGNVRGGHPIEEMMRQLVYLPAMKQGYQPSRQQVEAALQRAGWRPHIHDRNEWISPGPDQDRRRVVSCQDMMRV